MTDCVCGQPLHYASDIVRLQVEREILEHGEMVLVRVKGEGTWAVPRHFMALHRPRAVDMGMMAIVFGFDKVE